MLNGVSVFESEVLRIIELTENHLFDEVHSILDGLEAKIFNVDEDTRLWFTRSVISSRAEAYRAAGQTDLAIAEYAKIQNQLHREYSVYQHSIALALAKDERLEESLAALEEGLEAAPMVDPGYALPLLISYVETGSRFGRTPPVAYIPIFVQACKERGIKVESSTLNTEEEFVAAILSARPISVSPSTAQSGSNLPP